MSFRRILVLFVSVAAATSQLVFAQNQTVRIQQRADREPLRYLLYSPIDKPTDTSFPLVLFLHGGGEGGNEIERVKMHGLPKLIAAGKTFPFFVASPQNPSQTQFWDDQQLIRLIDELVAKHPIDESRVTSPDSVAAATAHGDWRFRIPTGSPRWRRSAAAVRCRT